VELGPLGTSTTEWLIVPAPGDCDDGEFGGMKIGRRNRSTRRKPALRHFVHHKSHLPDTGSNPGRRGGKPATNRLSYGTAMKWSYLLLWLYEADRSLGWGSRSQMLGGRGQLTEFFMRQLWAHCTRYISCVRWLRGRRLFAV
jgi:hypothetical protein